MLYRKFFSLHDIQFPVSLNFEWLGETLDRKILSFLLPRSYSTSARDNCQLCDRPMNQLDYYADIEPDRDFDIYAMTDDPVMCSKPRLPERTNNARKLLKAHWSFKFFSNLLCLLFQNGKNAFSGPSTRPDFSNRSFAIH